MCNHHKTSFYIFFDDIEMCNHDKISFQIFLIKLKCVITIKLLFTFPNDTEMCNHDKTSFYIFLMTLKCVITINFFFSYFSYAVIKLSNLFTSFDNISLFLRIFYDFNNLFRVPEFCYFFKFFLVFMGL